jgi:drug/metabolite transporter (DMT)-like permease
MLKWILLLATGLIWGSSFILMKKALIVYSPNQVASMRIFVASMSLFPWVIWRLKGLDARKLGLLLIAGLAGNGIPAFLFAIAQTQIDSSMAGMMNSLVPIIALVLGVVFFKMETHRMQIVGITLGLVGAITLMYDPSAKFIFNRPTWLILTASTLYAINMNVVGRYLRDVPAITVSGVALLWVGPVCGVYLFSTDFVQRTTEHDFAVWAFMSIMVLAVVGTAFALVLFNKLLSIAGTLIASMSTYIIPVFALMWGLLDGEQPEWFRVIGVLIILSGVYLVNKRKLVK